MKNIGILGSTGSIGTQTLEIIDLHDDLQVIALSANTNVAVVYKQCLKYRPKIVAMMNEESSFELKQLLLAINLDSIQVVFGMEGLIQVATYSEIDVLVTAVVGMIGLLPTIEAIKAHKTIALANKETLVTAGEIIMPLAHKEGVKIIPVDSEHSAIYQSLANTSYSKIEKVILTASGGPFRGYSKEQLENVTLEQALKHPNWDMGAKITIDSSTLMNKGLEVIEAKWLFDVKPDQIDVVVHPQSILHSMIQYIDGSCIGQMGLPDMKLPIQFALFEEERKSMPYPRLNLAALGQLTFSEPDQEAFPCLQLAYKALEAGKEIPTILNASNEKAVELFLSRKISYKDIALIIAETMETYQMNREAIYRENKWSEPELSIELILFAEQWAHAYIESRWKK
jgi:1-deoxy-D-xylulose-5-phosphate reductoisomerase